VRRRSTATAGLILSLAVALGVPAAWWWSNGSSADSAGSAAEFGAQSPSFDSRGKSPPRRDDLSRPPGQGKAPLSKLVLPADIPIVRSTDRRTSAPPARPTRVVLSSLDISARVVPVGVDEKRAVAVPSDAFSLGWYRFGRSPAERMGSTVIVGHRDSRTQGRGALYRLDELNPDDTVTVTLSDDTTVVYRVVERRFYLRDRLPSVLFGRDGAPRLTLITCGGPYDPELGYRDNLVVTAVPVEG